MGSQSRPRLSSPGFGIAHFPKSQIIHVKSSLEGPPNEVGQAISSKILINALFASNPFFTTIFATISLITIIQKVVHYAEIAEREGTDAAILAIMQDIASGAIRLYVTDTITDSLIDTENISPENRAQLEEIVGIIVDQGIDQLEEAFLNE